MIFIIRVVYTCNQGDVMPTCALAPLPSTQQGGRTRLPLGRVPVDAGVRLLDARGDPEAAPERTHHPPGASRAEHAPEEEETLGDSERG